jgi:DNA polymerase-1
MAARIFLIDGTALAYRSYFAFINRPLVNSKGEDTSAVYGFATTLLKLLREQAPDYVVLFFDTGAPTFRHRLHEAYKATREKMPEPMRAQLSRLHELAAAMRLPVVQQEGYEADDLIGTLALKARAQGLEVVIVTGDKDLMQLVQPGVRLLNPRRTGDDYEMVDAPQVREKFGVDPEQVVEVLGLMGDVSDNVPGVPGVGPKTAAQLIQEYGSLEAVLASAAALKRPKLRDSLVQYADQARLSKELVTLHLDSPVEFDPQAMARTGFDGPALRALFQELEFTRLLDQLELAAPAPAERPAADYVLVRRLEEVAALAPRLREAGAFAVDLETTSLDPLRARIAGISISHEAGHAVYLPVGHTTGDNLDLERVMDLLRPLLEDPGVRKWGQNVKYDTGVLVRHGVRPRGFDFDTMVADYLLDPADRQHSLDAMARHHLDHRMTPITDLIGKGKEQIGFDQVDPRRACAYSGEDADVALRLVHLLAPRLREQGLERLFAEVEMPLVEVLRDMELAGVAVDAGFLRDFSVELAADLDALKARIHAEAGEEFNINSTQQLARILFERIGLKPRRKTKTGFSTDVDVLEELAQEHPLPGLLLDYRELTKLKSTYVDALPALVHPDTGRIHASFNQTVTATGRLSVSEPNLQNIPVRTPRGRQIRRAFVAGGEGYRILSADYSQIELRLLAHLSGDEALGQAFRQGEDIHVRTACLVFGLGPEYITPQMRTQAKTVNFGVIYGQTPFGLSRQLGITQAQARGFIEQYFAAYPGVRRFIDATVARARQEGCVRTLLGRRRPLPDIHSANGPRREFAERTAVNTPIQGSQADMIKVAMVRIHRRLREAGLDARMILQVHDELVFEVSEADLEEVEALVRAEMVQALPLDVPVQVDSDNGYTWYEAH